MYFPQPGHKSFSRDRVTRFILGHFLRALRLLVAVGGHAAEAMRILLKAVSVFLGPRMCFSTVIGTRSLWLPNKHLFIRIKSFLRCKHVRLCISLLFYEFINRIRKFNSDSGNGNG
jgi:hypothetical protein